MKSTGATTGRTFCGVAQFTAHEGMLVMPRWMMDNLGVKNGDLVQVRRVSLPRAKFLRLLPHNSDFLQHTNPKALLEWVLPHYVALTPGDIIQISFDDKHHVLQVLEVSPGRAVCLTESDVTVDFAPPLTSTSSSKAPDPMAVQGSVLGTLEQEGVEGVDYRTCENCRAAVPAARFTTHTLSCPRINWYCETCKKVVQRSEKDAHIKLVHSPVPCPLGCGELIEKFMVDGHAENDCPKRNKTCEWCGLTMTASNWHSHESTCGDRTEICENCGLRVQRRDQFKHLDLCGKSTIKANPHIPRKSNDDLFQCEKCLSWLVGFDELQVHMLTQHENM